jgi:hypothetical protein
MLLSYEQTTLHVYGVLELQDYLGGLLYAFTINFI